MGPNFGSDFDRFFKAFYALAFIGVGAIMLAVFVGLPLFCWWAWNHISIN